MRIGRKIVLLIEMNVFYSFFFKIDRRGKKSKVGLSFKYDRMKLNF